MGTGGGGGPDTAFLEREAARRRKGEREERAKAKEADRAARRKIREEKRAAREGEDDEEEVETESEAEDEEDSESDEDEEKGKERGYGLNRFGTAFNDVIGETGARVRIDSFEHCVVEVKKEDLGGFLEALSMKAVVG